jgi:hypothetical protein
VKTKKIGQESNIPTSDRCSFNLTFSLNRRICHVDQDINNEFHIKNKLRKMYAKYILIKTLLKKGNLVTEIRKGKNPSLIVTELVTEHCNFYGSQTNKHQ